MPENFNFPRTTPEEQGVSSSVILDFVNALDNSQQEIHSYMLVKNAHVIAEGWWSPYAVDIPHMMFSLSKSFTSTAVGMAVDEGYFTVDDAILPFFPDATPDTVTDNIANMQIKHLLTMSTGHEEKSFPFMYSREDGNWAKGFFETPVVYEPGTHFLYNTGATYMLSELVQRQTGQTLTDYLTPRLFEPLGIQSPVWMQSPHGIDLGGIGLNLVTEDIARFGQLYLQKGMWQGKRLLSEAWIAAASSAQVSNGSNPDSDWEQGYGYQFWRCRHGLYRGDGAFGQFCIVMDEYDTVLAMTSAAQDMQEVMNIAWDILLPGLKNGASSSETTVHNALVEKSENLALLPVTGQSTSAIAEKISGKEFLTESNALNIEKLTFEFTGSECCLTFKIGEDNEGITAGYGKWIEGQASFFDEIWLSGSLPLLAGGAWQSENTYIMQIRLYKTPYIYTLTCDFEGDSVTLTIQINVSLESTELHSHVINAKLS